MEIHHTSTIRNSPAKANNLRGLRDLHRAQIPNATNASASATRSHAHGKFEKYMAKVAQPTSATRKRNPRAINSQSRGLSSQEVRVLEGRSSAVVIYRWRKPRHS